MKILIINGIYGSRSSGRSIADIRTILSARGDRVFVATPEKYLGDDFYRIGNKFDHKLHAVLSRLTGKQAFFSHLATYGLLRYMDKVQPDLVHIQVIHGNYLNFPMLMRYLAKKAIPAVFVLDDCWYFTGKCCHYTAEKCYKWQTQCGECPRVHQDNPSFFFDRSRSMYRIKKRLFVALPRYAVVTVSDWLKREVGRSYLKDAAILRRIYNAIDIAAFQPRTDGEALKAQLGLSGKKVILGVAANWRDHNGLSKGIGFFIRLAKMLPDDVRIVLIGKPDETRMLPGNILSIPFVSGAMELSRYDSMADVFVQMSQEETFGKVTAEALSCGTPVVVFDSTANPELVGPGCGAVAPPGDIDAMFREITGILANGKKIYADACRRFAVEHFDAKRISGEFAQLYQELLRK